MEKIDYSKYNPVRPTTFQGKLLVNGLRFLFHIRRLLLLPQWRHLVPNHHEDPLKMTFREKLYMGYKYYFKPLLQGEKDSGIEDYFRRQSLALKVPDGFIPEATVTLSAGGDLIPYTIITPENCEHLWDEAGDFFFGSDIVFANLETVADTTKPYSAAPEVMLHDMYFNIGEESFRIFSGNGKYRGYDVLATANNHSLDLGTEGLQATMQFLKNKSIAYCGSAITEQERDSIPIIERNGIRIAFIAYTFSLNKHELPDDKQWMCNHLNLNEADADISLIIHQAAEARSRGADIVVAALHMGCAYQAYPNMHTVHNMHRICAEAGIDIVLGGHPHNMQPLEVYETTDTATGNTKQHLIVYSQGDFVAYDIFKWCHLTLLLKLHIAVGKLNGKRHVQLTKMEAKPFYMHVDQSQQLRFVDFRRVCNEPEKHFSEKSVIEEVIELNGFLHDCIFTEQQLHVMA